MAMEFGWGRWRRSLPTFHLGPSALALWGADDDEVHERPALGALAAYVATCRRREPRARRVRLALSGVLCRWASVPWHARLADAGTAGRHAVASLVDQYGDAAATWQVTMAAGRHGTAQVACAAPPNLLPTLDRLCGPLGLDLAEVSPLAVLAFNAVRAGLPAGAGALAVIEPECATVLRWSGRDVLAVQSLPIHEGPVRSLSAWSTRRELAGDVPGVCAVTVLPAAGSADAADWSRAGWKALEFPAGLLQCFDMSASDMGHA